MSERISIFIELQIEKEIEEEEEKKTVESTPALWTRRNICTDLAVIVIQYHNYSHSYTFAIGKLKMSSRQQILEKNGDKIKRKCEYKRKI